MQKISFTTVSAGTIEIDDVNISSVSGEKILRLNRFDGGSAKTRTDSVQSIGMSGRRVISVTADVRTITAGISFAPVYTAGGRTALTGYAGMHRLRREVLKRFPLGETGTLRYTNDNEEYEIPARIDETPVVTVKDGFLCECELMFTADYPYWCRKVRSEKKTVSGSPISFSAANLGDLESPISGTILCTSDLGEVSAGDCFRLSEGGSANSSIHFVRPLVQYDELFFSLEYGNEFIVRKRINYGDGRTTDWTDAYNYISFPTLYEPCRIRKNEERITGTVFYFSLFTSGELEVQLTYNYLYNVI